MLSMIHRPPPGPCSLPGGKFGQARLLATLLPMLWLAGCASAPPAAEAGHTESTAVATAQPSAEVAQGSRWERRNEVRCIDTKITGSHFQRRVCMTEAQWDKLEQDSRQLLLEWQGPKGGAR